MTRILLALYYRGRSPEGLTVPPAPTIFGSSPVNRTRTLASVAEPDKPKNLNGGRVAAM